MQWLNEPPDWTASDRQITLLTGPKTDFWRKTHYDFIRDSGHFYFQRVTGDFRAEVKFSGDYTARYDQAGLMLRRDARHWIKTGIEYIDGVQHVSAVVTRDFSDWSVVPLAENPPALWLRLTRQGDGVEMHYALDGATYHLLRLAYFDPAAAAVAIGVMAAAPDGEGFRATFDGFRVEQL